MSCTFVEIQGSFVSETNGHVNKKGDITNVCLTLVYIVGYYYFLEIFDDIDKIQGYRFIKPNLIFETTRIVCDLWIEGTNLCYSDGYVKIKLFQWSC